MRGLLRQAGGGAGDSHKGAADEPIPVLNGQTPRQTIRTPAGLERVKGLLRSYEEGEAE